MTVSALVGGATPVAGILGRGGLAAACLLCDEGGAPLRPALAPARLWGAPAHIACAGACVAASLSRPDDRSLRQRHA